MMKIDVYTEKYKIVESGSIILDSSEEEISFKISEETKETNVIFQFITADDKKTELKRSMQGNTIRFVCTNFEDTTGSANPFKLTDKLYMHFRHYLTSETTRRLEYTFLTEV